MIYPILLCGGSGTRLWPLSRQSYPKQFSKLVGESSLFQMSAERLQGGVFSSPVILTNSDFRFIVTEQLMDIGIDPGAILIEPEGKNTAPAILAAALWLQTKDPDAMMLVAPSDHIISDTKSFHTAVQSGIDAANSGDLVTFGVTPNRPETGYGYLELEETNETGAIKLKRFIEKPDLATAEKMITNSNYLWNAGIFLFSVRSILKAFKTHAPDLLDPVKKSVDLAKPDLGFLRLDTDSWAKVRDISIDYAVMEHTDNLSVIPLKNSWSDLGGWDAVWRATEPDDDNVAHLGNATAIDCENTLLRSESATLEIVGIGLENIMAIAMPDAVLVANMDRAQDVGKAVAALAQKGAKQATEFPRAHRPWGWFETLVTNEQFQVKRIVVHSGAALSLQSHVHRSEHWVVVKGTAIVTLDGVESSISENQSIYIPAGAIHRLANQQAESMILIEVQVGTYLGEDDITRYDDFYARK